MTRRQRRPFGVIERGWLPLGMVAVFFSVGHVQAFTFPSLRLTATNGTENYIFTDGDKIVPVAVIDSSRWYQVSVLDSLGAVVFQQTNFVAWTNWGYTNNSFTIQSSNMVSTDAPYTFRIQQFTNGSGLGTVSNLNKFFWVARVTEVLDAAGDPASRLVQGDTASIHIDGLRTNSSNWSVTWIAPGGATNCANVTGNDRPESQTDGTFPVPGPTEGAAYLVYPPAPNSNFNDAWNVGSNYEVSGCQGLGYTNEGQWRLRLQLNTTNFVVLAAFVVSNDCFAPTLVSEPANATLCSPANAVFTSTASSPRPTSVQWQSSIDGSTFTNIANATNTTLTLTSPTLADSGKVYRARFINICGATFSTNAVVIVNPRPTATVSGGGSGCPGSSADIQTALTGTGPWTVVWSDGVTQSGIAASPASRTVSPVSTTTYTVTGVADANCTNTATGSALVTILAAPVVTANPTNRTVCNNAAVIFTVAFTANPAPFVQWQSSLDGTNFSDIANATNATLNFAASWADTGKRYRARLTSACGAATSGVATLTVNPACFITGPEPVCVNAALAYAAPAGMNNYAWSISGNGSINGNAARQTVSVIAGATAGAFTLVLTITDGSGCTASCTNVVVVQTPPAATVSGSGAICLGGSVNIQAALSGTGPWTVRWSDGVTQTNVAASPASRAVSPAINTTYTVTNLAGAACSGTSSGSAVVTVSQPAFITTNPVNRVVCESGLAAFTITRGGSPTPVVQWQVSTDGTNYTDVPGGTNTTLIFTATLGDSGNQYRAVAGNLCGVATSTAASLIVNALPACSITGASALCAGSVGNSFTAPADMADYRWSISGNATINGTANNRNVNVTAGAAGSFTMTLTVTNANGCSSVCIRTVTVNPLPACAITGSNAVCASSSGSEFFAPAGMAAYAWSIGTNGTITSVANADSVIVSAGVAGTFTLTVTTTDTNGCSSTCTKVVTVNALPVCSISGTNSVCEFSTNRLYTAPAGMRFHTWSVTGDGAINGAATNQTLSVNAGNAGTFTVYLTLVNSNGCSSTCSQVVTVNPPPHCSISGAAAVCATSTSNLFAAPAGMAVYRWTISGSGGISGTATNQTVSVNASNTGVFTLALSVTNSSGCSSTCSILVVVNARPTATVSGTAAICLGDSATIEAALTGAGPWTVVWSDGVTQTNVSASPATRSVSPAVTTTYTVTGVNDVNCSNTGAGSAVITMNSPVFTAPPTNKFACTNSVAMFSYAATGSPVTLAQWQVSTNGGTNFNDVANATNSTLTFMATMANDGWLYQVSLSNTCGVTLSASALLTLVTTPAVGIVTEPLICEGSSDNVAVVSNAPAGSSFGWSIVGGAITGGQNSSNVIYSVDAGATMGLTVNVTNAGGCVATATRMVSTINSGKSVIEGWANLNQPYSWLGSLNGGTHRYSDGQVLPFRLILDDQCGGAGWCATLEYDFIDTSGGPTNGFIDSLATYDHTELGASGNGCSGYTCGAATTYPIPMDTNSNVPSGAQIPGNFTVFNGAITSVSGYTTIALGGGSSRKQITLHGVAASGGVQDVIILFGAHMARENEWGAGNAASGFNGSAAKMFGKLCSESSLGIVSVNLNDFVPLSDLGVTQTATPSPACVGSPMTYTLDVRNHGPLQMAGVKLTNALPAGVTFVSSVPAPTLTNGAGELVFSLGTVFAGADTNVLITVIPTGTGSATLTNVASVSRGVNDPRLANQYASNLTFAIHPVLIVAQPPSATLCPGQPASFSVIATGTPPLLLQWYFNGNALAGATNSTLAIASVDASHAGDYSVTVSNYCHGLTSAVAVVSVRTNLSATALSPLTVCPGDRATFSTVASGTGPFTFAWFQDGAPIPGATNSSLSFVNVTNNNAAVYTVEATGPCNRVTNSATLAVLTNTAASELAPPTGTIIVCPGALISFATTPSGTGPFTFAWTKDDVLVPDAVTNSLGLANVVTGDAGTYRVIVSGRCNSVTNSAVLIVTTGGTATPLTHQASCPGGTVTFSTTVAQTDGFYFVWSKVINDVTTPIATNASRSLTLSNISAADAGTYSVNAVGPCFNVTSFATLTVYTNTTAAAPASVALCVGGDATFTATPSGSGPFRFAWRHDGVLLADETNETLAIATVAAGDTGVYSVEVSGVCGSVTNSATLTLDEVITSTPLNDVSACPGDIVSLGTVVSGTGPFTYAWLKDGALLSGATNASLVLSNLSASATYAVTVFGACNAVTNSAVLTLKEATGVVLAPVPPLCPGRTAVLTATATGTGPFAYTWFKGVVQIPGATNDSLIIANATGADADVYRVDVLGNCNLVSASSTLIVLTNTTASGPSNALVCSDSPAAFVTVPSGTGPFAFVWRKDGLVLGEATNDTLTLGVVGLADAGVYSVEVSGACQRVTNSATLAVLANTTATALADATVCDGIAAVLGTVASGTGPFSYAWSVDTTPTGTNGPELSVNAAVGTHIVAVIVTGVCGAVTNSATLTVQENTSATGPADAVVCFGPEALFSTVASGTGPFSYQWSVDTTPTGTNGPALNVNAAVGTHTVEVIVTGACGTVTNSATLTVRENTSATGPADATVCFGTEVVFSTVAVGTAPFSYAWSVDGTPAGTNGPALNVNAVVGTHTVAVVVAGACGAVTNSATLMVQENTSAIGPVDATVCFGTDATFSTVANGTAPFSYSWSIDGVPVGTNGPALNVNAVVGTHTVAVVVAGACGSVTNSATLAVRENTGASGLANATVCLGTEAVFSTTASGTGPFSYQWAVDGLSAGTNGPALSANSSAGIHTVEVIVTGACGAVTNTATLTVQVDTSAAALSDVTICHGAEAAFSTKAAGTAPFSYQWSVDGLPAGTNGPGLGVNADVGTHTVEVIVAGLCGAVTNSATLTVQAGTGATGPANATVCFGTEAVFNTVAAGTAPFSYQWSVGGAPAGTNGPALGVNVAVGTHAVGVIVAGLCGAVTNSATLTVQAGTGAVGPANAIVCFGTEAVFTTTAAGTAPFSYQWSVNGLPAGTNGPALNVNAAVGSHSVEVVVAGACGAITNSATLTVRGNTGASALLDATVCQGGESQFDTVASGTGPFSYQWSVDGSPAGTNGPALAVFTAAMGVGAHSVEVIVAGACGAVTHSATLAVRENTTATRPADATVCRSDLVSFATVAGGTGPFGYLWSVDGEPVGTNGPALSLATGALSVGAHTVAVTVAGPCGVATNSAILTVRAFVNATPLADLVRCSGDTATFSITPSGTGPFTFVWRHDGLALADQTNSSLTIATAVAADAGVYTVEVSGPCNIVTNSAVLSVSDLVSSPPMGARTVCLGASIPLEPAVNGTGPFTYVWRFNDGLLAGETNGVLTVSNASVANNGAYAVEILGACNTVTNTATLTAITALSATPLTSLARCSGDSALFSTIVTGTPPFSFVWRRNGALLDGETNSTLALGPLLATQSGAYAVEVMSGCGSLTNTATLAVISNTVAAAFASQTRCPGGAVSFTTTASGMGPFTYVWRHDGVVMAGRTNNSISIIGLVNADSGVYSADVAGTCGSATNSATLTVQILPVISGLTNQTVCQGADALLAPTVTGTQPLTCVWRRNGTLVPGQTNSTYLVTAVTAVKLGTYSLEVYNPSCADTTNSMVLTMGTNLTAGVLTNLSRCLGGTAAFSLNLTGTPPLSIVWRKDGAPIAGQTNSSLSLSNLTLSDAGTYSIEVAVPCGSLSRSATLTMSAATTATALAPQTACPGGTVVLDTVASGQAPFTYVWRRNGNIIPGSTGTLVLTDVNAGHVGTYSVVVSGGCGSVTNSTTVSIATPVNSSMALLLTVCGCADTNIGPTVTGTGPITYQWWKDGGVLIHETNQFLALLGANNSTPGLYTVRVAGPCNTVTNNVLLSVEPSGRTHFEDPSPIIINDSGPSDPYPAQIEVRCAPRQISKVRVTLYNVSHAYPDDIDIMLVSPQNQSIVLWSDAGGAAANYLSGDTISFEDGLAPLPNSARIFTGNYRPTDHPGDDDPFEAPSPGSPSATLLDALAGNPNGYWRLFIVDDHSNDAGEITGGWGMTFFGDNGLGALRLDNPSVTNGVFSARLSGIVGNTYSIQGSADLIHWTPIGETYLDVSPKGFTDTNSVNMNYRFYRATGCGN